MSRNAPDPLKVCGQSADESCGMVCMVAQAQTKPNSQPTLLEIGNGLRYLARQPIMDLRGKVCGYELLYRAGPEESFRGDGNLATRTMLDNTMIFGLDRLAGGVLAFVNCTLESLTESLVRVLPPSGTVLEILENLDPTPSLIHACGKLKALGFRLALDDFTWKPGFEPLVKLADYIKVDFMQTDAQARQILLNRLRGVTTAQLVAEKIETQEEYKQARQEGFTLFQGYYFCRPVLLKSRKIPANKLSQIKILQLLRSEEIDLDKLIQLMKREASLTYRLLRLANSPICAIRREVRSIRTALVMVGDEAFRRLALLAITSELNAGQPEEILRMAFVRGRFCELAASLCALDPTEQYLLGMLSLLPAMMRFPMEKLSPDLPLRGEICEALEGKVNPESILLQWIESCERGDWAACDAVAQAGGLNQQDMAVCYFRAMIWAEAALQLAV
jgi:EAL and modified HD-GYP domain-containing signal transduction protein